MACFIAVTSSNTALVSEPDQVGDILARYYLNGDLHATLCQDDQDGRMTLVIWGYDWPSAWKVPPDTNPDSLEPDWDDDGDDGFEQLLKDIAPFLAESLIVQAIGAEACRFPLVACEWQVQPHAEQIEVNGFRCREAEPVLQ